jgi:glycosyltransferase involved in cell wall biosynthesis
MIYQKNNKSTILNISILVISAFVIRIFAFVNTLMMNNDGPVYIHQARAIYHGPWHSINTCMLDYPILYTVLIAAAYPVTGAVSKERLIRMYLAGDIYIMLSKFDTFGNVVLEAMAAGLPVIISCNIGAKNIVQENENGFIVGDLSDTDYIAAKVALLLDENIRRKMSAAASQTATQNTWDNVTKKYAAIYENIRKEKRS